MTRTRTKKAPPLPRKRTRRRQRGYGLDIQKWLSKTGIEFHWPGYQYMGPATKRKKQLARGDPGINRLDKLAKQHDIDFAILIHIKSEELKQKKGPGFWKFNQSFLHDENYVALLRVELENFKQKYIDVEDLNLRWDLIKMEIRGFTVKYSKNKSRERKSTFLQNRINELFKRAEAEPNNKHIICEIQSIRLRLKKIMQHKTKGAILRSKVRWYENGERNTRYFYNLEKRNYEKKTISI